MSGSPKDMYIGFAAIVVIPAALFTVFMFPPNPLVGLRFCMPSRFRSVPNPKSSPEEEEKGSREEGGGRLCPSPNAPGEERKREDEGSEASLDSELLLPFTAPGRVGLAEGRAKSEL